MTTTIAAGASKDRPTRLSRLLATTSWGRRGLVYSATLLAATLALLYGFDSDRPLLEIDKDDYLLVAGLFVVALAIERLTELLVAPFVGSGDNRYDRNMMVGSCALLLGVAISGPAGLSVQAALFDGYAPSTGGGFLDAVKRGMDILATGLLVGAGTKPLHDLIARHEKKALAAKAAAVLGDGSASSPLASSGDHEIVIQVTALRQPAQKLRKQLQKLKLAKTLDEKQLRKRFAKGIEKALPGWKIDWDAAGAVALVKGHTAAAPGTGHYIGAAFSAAHRVNNAGAMAVPILPDNPPVGAPENRRWALEAMGVTPDLMAEANWGADVVVGVIDSGIAEHEFGIQDWESLPYSNVLKTSGGPGLTANPNDPVVDPLSAADEGVISGVLLTREVDFNQSRAHGTKVAAVIAAPGKDADLTDETARQDWYLNSEMLGVAPRATVAPIRAAEGIIHINDKDIPKAFAVASQEAGGGSHGPVDPADLTACHVISMSMGGWRFDKLDEAIDQAIERGAIVVTAAGNSVGFVVAPARYPSTIAAAGTAPDGQPYEGSSRGPEITVTAPGAAIWKPSFRDPQRMSVSNGTTYATAHIAGLAALWLSHHGRDELIAAYGPSNIQDLFRLALTSTATPWEDEHLSADWGAGRVNARALLDFQVLDGTSPVFDPDELASARPPESPLPEKDVPAALLGDVFTGTASDLLGKVIDRLAPRPKNETLNPEVAHIPLLVDAEVAAHAALDGRFGEQLVGGPGLDIPDGVSDELRRVLEQVDPRTVAKLPKQWGAGFSWPLRRVLLGRGGMVQGRRFLGVIALVFAAFIAYRFDTTDTIVLSGAIGIFVASFYAAAQVVERVLEWTVGRWAYRDVPGREADRALIMLGAGVVLATAISAFADFGLMRELSDPESCRNLAALEDEAHDESCSEDAMTRPERGKHAGTNEADDEGRTDDDPGGDYPDNDWFRRIDLLITGLALGGGAKPVHDLLTRIRARS